MDISKKAIFHILGSNFSQYFIPVYQRQYAWKIKNCEQLLENILEIKNFKKQHYLGSLVISKPEVKDGVNVMSIIDGQQRLTTLTIFILSFLCSRKIKLSDSEKENLKNIYIINNSSSSKTRMKFIDSDQKIFESIINSLENKMKWDEKLTPEQNSTIFVENLKYFINKIEQYEFSLTDINYIFNNTICASINLEEKDNAQLIFETMNSTGLNLNQGDLIKNFLLLDLSLENQKNVYYKYWQEIENFLLKHEKMDIFFKHYLTIKNEKICNENQIYQTFKMYYNEKFENIENHKIEEIENIYKYFKSFKCILECNTSSNEINKSLYFLNILSNDTINPIVIEVIRNFIYSDELEWKNEEKIKSIIDILLSYVVRRQFCDLPSNSINKVIEKFVKYTKENDWYEKLCNGFISIKKTSKSLFPTDDEFKEKFIKKDFYFMRNKKEILQILESFSNWKNNEFSNITKKATLEHIMPQGENLPYEWKKELGENWKNDWNEWVQTIGNITFTKYNSEMSNDTFLNKKNMNGGFLDTNIWLNKYINLQDSWNIEKIKERANLLFDQSLKIWPYPKVSSEIREKYKLDESNEIFSEDSVYDLEYYNLDENEKNLYYEFTNFLNNNFNQYPIDIFFNKNYAKVDIKNKTLFRLVFRTNKILIYLSPSEKFKTKNLENNIVIYNPKDIHFGKYTHYIIWNNDDSFFKKLSLSEYIKDKIE
ncbi:MAG: DUF262 domain-containing HNH endonuclease family protein [Malacoplasma sp.]|nr:DUF262 domain-containing HNH endonuclease family protein [Malacoplasma sp.]